jgi:SAM-dependent methyltransferase
MRISNLEYISLRLLRRFILPDAFLLRFGRFIPYYRTNRNQVDPSSLVDDYALLLSKTGFPTQGQRLLEIGVGRTNSSCYEIVARFLPESVLALEPFVSLGTEEDSNLLRQIAERHHCEPSSFKGRVRRIQSLGSIPDHSVDLVLSSSVLEHVSDPLSLFSELRRVLSPQGAMLHLVDYRDHFFKYPFHFLQFRKATWNRWLNPGDLPVWRLYDHLTQLEDSGFEVRVLAETRDPAAFSSIASRVASDYLRDQENLQTTTAALWAIIQNPA